MIRKVHLVLVLAQFSLTSFAVSRDVRIPQTVVSDDYTCVLSLGSHAQGGQASQVKCAHSGEPWEEIADLVNPKEIAVGTRLGGAYGSYGCAITQGGVHCWGLEADSLNRFFSRQTHPALISAGNSDLCVYDDVTGLSCYQSDVPWTSIASRAPTDLTPLKELSVGSLYACALDIQYRLICWGGPDSNFQDLFPSPEKGEISLASQSIEKTPEVGPGAHLLRVGLSHACVAEGDSLKCWGLDVSHVLSSVNDFHGTVRDLALGIHTTCILEEATIQCFGESLKETPSTIASHGAFPFGISLSEEAYQPLEKLCVTTDAGVSCFGEKPFQLPNIDLGLSLGQLEQWYQRASYYTYGAKAVLFSSLAQLAHSLRPEHGAEVQNDPHFYPLLFLLKASWILVDNTQTVYFEQNLAREFGTFAASYCEPRHIESLRDIPPSPQTIRLTLNLIHSAFKAVDKDIPLPDFRKALEDINLNLGETLADTGSPTPDQLRVLSDSMKKAEPYLNWLDAYPRTHAVGLFLKALATYVAEFPR